MKPIPMQHWIHVAGIHGSAFVKCGRCGFTPTVQPVGVGEGCPTCSPIYEAIEELQQAALIITDTLENLGLTIEAQNRILRDLEEKT